VNGQAVDSPCPRSHHIGRLLLALLIERASDEGHLALRATVLADNSASMAMLRRAEFVGLRNP